MCLVVESLPPIAPLFELVRVFKPELLPVFLCNIAFCCAEGVELLFSLVPFSLGRLALGADPGREPALPADEFKWLKATLCC